MRKKVEMILVVLIIVALPSFLQADTSFRLYKYSPYWAKYMRVISENGAYYLVLQFDDNITDNIISIGVNPTPISFDNILGGLSNFRFFNIDSSDNNYKNRFGKYVVKKFNENSFIFANGVYNANKFFGPLALLVAKLSTDDGGSWAKRYRLTLDGEEKNSGEVYNVFTGDNSTLIASMGWYDEDNDDSLERGIWFLLLDNSNGSVISSAILHGSSQLSFGFADPDFIVRLNGSNAYLMLIDKYLIKFSASFSEDGVEFTSERIIKINDSIYDSIALQDNNGNIYFIYNDYNKLKVIKFNSDLTQVLSSVQININAFCYPLVYNNQLLLAFSYSLFNEDGTYCTYGSFEDIFILSLKLDDLSLNWAKSYGGHEDEDLIQLLSNSNNQLIIFGLSGSWSSNSYLIGYVDPNNGNLLTSEDCYAGLGVDISDNLTIDRYTPNINVIGNDLVGMEVCSDSSSCGYTEEDFSISSANYDFSVEFVLDLCKKFTLNVEVEGNGTVQLNTGQECKDNCTFRLFSERIKFKAIPDKGYSFVKWEGDYCNYCNDFDLFGKTTCGCIIYKAKTGNESYTCRAVFESNGTIPNISVSPGFWNFGTVQVGNTAEKDFVVRNVGGEDLSITGVSITGTDTSEFSISVDHCNGTTLNPGGNCTITVAFSPQSAGSKNATLEITSNGPDEGTVSVALSGTGKQWSFNLFPIIISFTAEPVSREATLTVEFRCEAEDPDGYIMKYKIDYGDGYHDTSTTGRFIHTYNDTGTYTVTCEAVDNGWFKDKRSVTVVVAGAEEQYMSPPDHRDVGLGDPRTGPVRLSESGVTVDFRYRVNVDIAVGWISEDFGTIRWLDPSECRFVSDYVVASQRKELLCSYVSLPGSGYVFWLVSAVPLEDLDFDNGSYELRFYYIGK